MRRVCLLAVVVLLVLSGCTGFAPELNTDSDTENGLERGDLGEVNGYTYDDELGIDGTETLSDDELEAVTYRAMARIEVLRGLPFEEDVDVEIISREEHQEEGIWTGGESDTFTNEVWRGSFVVDGETDYDEALEELYGGSVQGYYVDGRIAIVTDDPDDVQLDRTTLVHELVHALQDQHFGLAREGDTIDEQRAEEGLIEGEANYIPFLYEEQCESAWECLEGREQPAPDLGFQPFNVGLFASIYMPYAEGPTFVEHLHETEGWDAVDDAFEDRPASTEQVIHPERYPDVEPVDVTIEDRSGDGWEPITDDSGDNDENDDNDSGDENADTRTETIGEATLFSSLFANGVVDRPITEGGTDRSPYNYSHPATDGWAGDLMVVYQETDDQNRTGHVWGLTWHTEEDAEQFHDAYLELLAEHEAEEVDSDTYVVPEDAGFTGAYHVTLEGEELTIVGGPDLESLGEIHEPAATSSSTALVTASPTTTFEPRVEGMASDAPVSATG